jgi:hypothetical protein
LRPEPRNRRDRRAVAVYSGRGVQIGYLTAERCGWIGALIAEGREPRAIFQDKADFGAWIRVAFDGEEPVLPPPRPARAAVNDQGVDPDPGFEPDPDWPEGRDPDYWGSE